MQAVRGLGESNERRNRIVLQDLFGELRLLVPGIRYSKVDAEQPKLVRQVDPGRSVRY